MKFCMQSLIVVAGLAFGLPLLGAVEEAGGLRIEHGRAVLDSPFALEIGSTEYAKVLGERVRTSAHANYDPQTKKTTTNFYHQAEVDLSKPYFGFTRLSLNFKGEEKYLECCSFSMSGRRPSDKRKKMSYAECREMVDKIAADLEKQRGIVMRCTSDHTEEEAKQDVQRRQDENRQKKRNLYGFSLSFVHYNGERQGKTRKIEYLLSGMLSDKGEYSVSFSYRAPFEFMSSYKPGDRIPVYTNEMFSTTSRGLVPTAEQKKAHEEAKRLRGTINRLFGIDLDKPSETNELSSAIWRTNGQDKVVREWSSMPTPFEGMTERKVNQSVMFLAIPFGTFALRRPYPADATAEEMKEQAKRFLVRLEREYGEKIPEADTKDGVEMLAKRFGEGVPTFGDTKALLGLDKKTYFMGKVGDLGVEIAYCEPRYAKRGGTYEIVCRGAVVVNIVQSPVLTTGKQKK